MIQFNLIGSWSRRHWQVRGPGLPGCARTARDQFRHEKAAPPGGSAAMRFVRPWTYLVSFFMPDMPASGVAVFFALCFFFVFMAWAFMGSLAFTVGCAAGPVVWAEATDTLPTRAAQHAATISLRILISRLVKERPITARSRKGSGLGTAQDISDASLPPDAIRPIRVAIASQNTSTDDAILSANVMPGVCFQTPGSVFIVTCFDAGQRRWRLRWSSCFL